MCLPKEIPQFMAKPRTPPRSPWRRLRQQLKPRLSRRVVTGARVNLNDFWSKFEDLSNNHLPITTLVASPQRDNEINENILNELIEASN